MAHTGVDVERMDAREILQERRKQFQVFLFGVVVAAGVARAGLVRYQTLQVQWWRGDCQRTRGVVARQTAVRKSDRRLQVAGGQGNDGTVEVQVDAFIDGDLLVDDGSGGRVEDRLLPRREDVED